MDKYNTIIIRLVLKRRYTCKIEIVLLQSILQVLDPWNSDGIPILISSAFQALSIVRTETSAAPCSLLRPSPPAGVSVDQSLIFNWQQLQVRRSDSMLHT